MDATLKANVGTMNEMEFGRWDAEMVCRGLYHRLSARHIPMAVRAIDLGMYRVYAQEAPADYDKYESSTCHGWLTAGVPQYINLRMAGKEGYTLCQVVATYADGENGDEPYDPDTVGLCFWVTACR